MIDCANDYDNEHVIGEALQELFAAGKVGVGWMGGNCCTGERCAGKAGGVVHPGEAVEFQPPARARPPGHREDVGGPAAGLPGQLRDPLATGGAQQQAAHAQA